MAQSMRLEESKLRTARAAGKNPQTPRLGSSALLSRRVHRAAAIIRDFNAKGFGKSLENY
jgi:hypothetical protein